MGTYIVHSRQLFKSGPVRMEPLRLQYPNPYLSNNCSKLLAGKNERVEIKKNERLVVS